MKKNILLILMVFNVFAALPFISCRQISSDQASAFKDTKDATNDFYDNAEVYNLKQNTLKITGEVEKPVVIDFSSLPLHRVIVKEAVLKNNSDKFIGAYCYEGYSLYDILNNIKLNKKNSNDFNPITDLYIEVSNASGDCVKISWGEIYYPNHLHQIIIASKVRRIVPSKSKDLWPLPEKSKLVVGTDLVSERNIVSPVGIKVKSYGRSIKTEKGKTPLFSKTCIITKSGEKQAVFASNPDYLKNYRFKTIFYGRGRGIHGIQTFTGICLKDLLAEYFSITKETLKKGAFAVIADDGYRAVFTFSEIFNRNDQQEILLTCDQNLKNNGIFRIFPSGDFFSDRAVKAVTEICYFEH